MVCVISFTLSSYRIFTYMFLAQVILMSADLIHHDLLEKVLPQMETFLHSTTPTELMRCEETRRFSWSVFFPYVKVVYLPDIPISQSNSSLVYKAQLLALEVVILWLRSTLGRMSHQEILIQEGLLDYIICIPWHIPDSVASSARALVSVLGTQTPITPPRLSSLAKAKLAKTQFGLDKVFYTHSVHDFWG